MPRPTPTTSLPSRCFAKARAGLSHDEERRLARLARQGDERAFERLVESHVPLAYTMANEFGSFALPAEDLVSEALLGLVKGTRGFDPDRGARLATYAAWWIRAYLRRYTIENRRIVRGPQTRNARKLLAGLRKTERVLSQLHGERPKAEAIASALGVSAREVEEMRSVLGARDVPCDVEIQGRRFELPSDGLTPEAIVGDAEERRIAVGRLRGALSQLDARGRHVLEKRQLSPETSTLATLARELGVSRQRVNQIERAAKTRVRELLCA